MSKPELKHGASEAYDKPIRGWEPRRPDGSKKFTAPIRNQKAGKVTKPTFSKEATADEAVAAAAREEDGTAEVGDGEKKESKSLFRSVSNAFTKPIRGWEPRRSDGSAKFTAPIRNQKPGKVTKPIFSEASTPEEAVKAAELTAKARKANRGAGAAGEGEAGTDGGEDDYEEEEEEDGEEEEIARPPPRKKDFKGPHVVVAGGQGFVGSHTVLKLLEEGFVVTVIDSSVNSHTEALDAVRELVTPEQAGHLFVHEVDLADLVTLRATMTAVSQIKRVDVCMHFASLNATEKASRDPIRYHQVHSNGRDGRARPLPALCGSFSCCLPPGLASWPCLLALLPGLASPDPQPAPPPAGQRDVDHEPHRRDGAARLP